MPIPLGGDEWDALGRIVMAVGLMAMLAYLVQGWLPLSAAWVRRLQIATIALITTALLIALAAAIAWFAR